MIIFLKASEAINWPTGKVGKNHKANKIWQTNFFKGSITHLNNHSHTLKGQVRNPQKLKRVWLEDRVKGATLTQISGNRAITIAR